MLNQLKWLLINSKIFKGAKRLIWQLQGDHLRIISPEALLLSQHRDGVFNRYDVVVRLLAIEELEGKNDHGQDLYHHLQVSRNTFLDAQGYRIKPEDRHQFKRGTLQNLIASFKQLGFDSQQPVAVNADQKLIDGSHRLACALYFGTKTITLQKTSAPQVDFSLEWFAQYFEPNQLEIIKQRYFQLLQQININQILGQILAREKQVFGRGTFYQSSEVLGIPGQRPTTERYRIYGLDELLNKQQRVLDIGCNCGFFALEIAKKVKSVIGIEIFSTLVEVGQAAQVYLGQSNVEFIQGNFTRYRFDGKFDFICSFAVHYWLGMDMEKYGKLLFDLLNPGGKVILESQNVEKEDVDWDKKLSLLSNAGFVEVRSGRIKDDGVIERQFTILQKRVVK